MSDPANPVPAVSPTGKPMLPQIAVIVLTVLGVAAGGVAAVGTAGVAIPAWLTAVAGAVTALCAAFGIASPGVRKQ